MGLGGIYAGIGLAQGLGQSSKAFIDSYGEAKDKGLKRQKEMMELNALKKAEEKSNAMDESFKRMEGLTSTDPTSGLGENDIFTLPPNKKIKAGLGDDLDTLVNDGDPKEVSIGTPGVVGKDASGKDVVVKKGSNFIADYKKSVDDVYNTGLLIQKEGQRMYSLTGDPKYKAEANQQAEEFYANYYARALGKAGNSRELLEYTMEKITGRQLKIDKGFGDDKKAFAIRDEQGNLISSISGLQMQQITSPQGFRDYLKTSVETSKAIAMEDYKLKLELDKIQKQHDLNVERDGFSAKADAQMLQAKLAVMLQISLNQNGGSDGVNAFIKQMDAGKISMQIVTRNDDGTIAKTTDSGALMQEFNNIMTELKQKNPDWSDQQIIASSIDSLRGRPNKLGPNQTINFISLSSGNPSSDQMVASLSQDVFGSNGGMRTAKPKQQN